jgi:hypothetical protein
MTPREMRHAISTPDLEGMAANSISGSCGDQSELYTPATTLRR